ncbi:MAG: PilW family protein [Pseudomonadota bacterium]
MNPLVTSPARRAPAMLPAIGRAAGFSIVELMVSVVVGLLAIMFATRLIVNAEQNKSVSLGGSDQMQNGMLALFSINNDAAQAGWGVNDDLVVGCDTVFSDTDDYELAQITRGGLSVSPLAAVVIANSAGSDQVSLYSGSALSGVGSVRVRSAYAGGNSIDIDTPAPFGFLKDDVIVVAPEPRDGNKCALAQLSASPLASVLSFGAGSTARFNAGTLGSTYGAGKARVYNLGPARLLSFHTWSVQNGVLLMRATNLAGAGAAPVSVVDNIVALKAQYGLDTRVGLAFDPSAGLQVTQWSNTMIDADGDGVAAGAGDFERVAAVRIAVVARSKNAEKADPVTGLCSATTVAPTMFASRAPATVAAVPVSVALTVTGDATDWKCYRYRVFETIVPIRNAGWRP